jgi:osmotically-inducible protein OsmY
MRIKSHKMFVLTAVLSFGLALPAFAQSENPAPASEQMNAAAESMKQAGSDTAVAAKDAYHGTATAVRDSEITAKIKMALHGDAATRHFEIHVTTSAGVVTLRGMVGSRDVAARAEQLAQNTKGVRVVKDELGVSSATIAE